MAVESREAFVEILEERQLGVVFQPIQDANAGTTVGYEALVRGPEGTPLASPDALLREAYRTDRVAEFDWAARGAACGAALAMGLPRGLSLFLNIEPLALTAPCPLDVVPIIDEAFRTYPIVLEITERSLERDPRTLLEGIEHQRSRVAGIAVDDVGSTPASLSLLPALGVDVIKLDLSVTQAGPSSTTLTVLDVAYQEMERCAATLLAEGVEEEQHASFARAMGADLLQGYSVGMPGPHPWRSDGALSGWTTKPASPFNVDTPFEALAGRRTSRADEGWLVPLGRHIATGDGLLNAPALVFVLVPEPSLVTEADDRALARLAERGVTTAALGMGAQRLPDRVRGGPLEDGDLDGEWAVVVLSPGIAAAMLARRHKGTGSEYDYAVTHDRQRVVAAAKSILRRLGPN